MLWSPFQGGGCIESELLNFLNAEKIADLFWFGLLLNDFILKTSLDIYVFALFCHQLSLSHPFQKSVLLFFYWLHFDSPLKQIFMQQSDIVTTYLKVSRCRIHNAVRWLLFLLFFYLFNGIFPKTIKPNFALGHVKTAS